jgi:hypothetical protein
MPISSPFPVRAPLNYKTLRATHKEIVDQILDVLSTQTLDLCAQRLGFWERGRPSIRHPLEAALVCDFALHDDRDPEDDRTPVERARDLTKPNTLAAELLSVMACANVDIWRVESVNLARGTARLLSRLAGVEHTITDQGLSQSAQPGDVFVIRPLQFSDMVITSGVVLPIPLIMVEPMVSALVMKIGAGSAEELTHLEPEKRAAFTASLFEMGAAAGGLTRTSGI